ncbi:MAG TPA: PfkB family carbohydrate kinase [Sedimentisphaerales bacterium]|nr:PfkB family carbohydrate kinase [Sedimentisphaerales bacterium]
MSLLVTGSIGIDTVTTPFGVSEDCLGGSSIYFSMAASFFGPVRLLGVIGPDCPFDLAEVFAGCQVDLAGLEVRKQSKTFRWKGTYSQNMDDRTTDLLELNVLAEAPPAIPEKYRDSRFVFLANTAPALQLKLLEQVDSPVFVAADTMNCWIQDHSADLRKLLGRIHCLVINEEEARLLAAEPDLIKAAQKITGMGPGIIIVKKGQSGSLTYNADGRKFLLPAWPAADVKDPTGAGDSFAGALMGCLAKSGKTDFDSLKTAVAYGTVVASFAIADFSLAGLTSISNSDIDDRFEALRKLTSF